MDKWELCRVVATGERFVAMTYTADGAKIIDQTPPRQELSKAMKKWESFDEECSMLIGRLLDAGWEPFETGPTVSTVTSFKRRKITS